MDSIKRTSAHKKSVIINFGTIGIGAELNYEIAPKLALRAGINAVPLVANDVFKISNFNSTSRVSADFYNIHALADYTPFVGASWLRLVGGLGYFFKANGNVRITPSDSYTYGDLVLPEDQVGYVDLNIDWKGIAPYFGIALLKSFPKKHFNINLDLGSYYLTKPKAALAGTGLLAGNSSQTSQFQSNIEDYRFLPVVQINFNVKL